MPDHWKTALVLPLLKKLGLDLIIIIVPDHWKTALVLPLLKKLGLDLIIIIIIISLLLSQLSTHCAANAPLPENQSSYREHHSTETALLKVKNDILLSIDRQEVTLLVLIDLSAAFDTIDHRILLETLEKDFGVIGDTQNRLASYLSERKHRILIKNHKSDSFNLESGVPQGSCLGPVLFLLYAAGLFKIIDKHLPNYKLPTTTNYLHSYADDTQIYLSFRPHPPVSQDAALGSIENCVADVRAWMLSNRLLINDTKTEFVIIGSRQQMSEIHIDQITVGESTIEVVKMVRNHGSWFDFHM